MTKLFLSTYRFFKAHKAVFYTILISTTVLFGFFASKIRFEENIATLLPKTEKSTDCDIAFGNIKVKDKVFLEILSRSGSMSTGELASSMDEFLELLGSKDEQCLIANTFSGIDSDDLMNILYYGMEALPCHLDASYYPLIDSLLNEEAFDRIAAGEMPVKMPDMGGLTLVDDHIFAPDSTMVMAFITPSFSSYDTWLGTDLEGMLSDCVKQYEAANPDCEVLYHGAVIEGTYNSRQIKKDLCWTIGISLLIICLIICFCFRSKSTLLHILLPIAYGSLFAMATVYWIKGYMSFMSIGIGAIIMGVAMSYCLHVLTHHKFVSDVESVIKEQAKPVCLGCITTIGAFVGLLFTSSELLQDFGLFASLMLLGTTFFVLVFLPQFFTEGPAVRNDRAFDAVNRFNSYPLDRNKLVVILLGLVTIVSIAFSGRVKFDNDLNHIGYKEPKVVRSEQMYNAKVNRGHFCQYFAAHADNLDSAIVYNRALKVTLDSLKEAGAIYSYSSVDGILIPEDEQRKNIEAWKEFWTPSKVSSTYELLKKEAAKYNWSSTGFDIPGTFKMMAEADYEPVSLYDAGIIPESLLCNFVENNADGWLVFTSVLMNRNLDYESCDRLTARDNIIVMDPFYYTGDMVEIAHKDFNFVVLFSSIFVFLVLLLSFRSLIVSVIAFLPMLLSWYIVQGIMAIFGIQFNLINIMISTFIFGIGVDYSIFVMDGLLSKAKYKSHRLLICHKAAIFFSGLTLLIVTGSLIFATHPAIYSVGISTIIGMSATILITYALQPLLFRLVLKNDWLRKKALREK